MTDDAQRREALLDWCRARLGQVVHTSPWFTVTQERIDRFAEASGDYQWIHVDPARAAAESPWKSTIAHGYLTLSLYALLRAPADGTPPWPGVRTVINYGLNRVRFTRAVRVNSRLRLNVTLGAVEAVPGAVQVVEACVFELDNDTVPACVAEMVKRLYV